METQEIVLGPIFLHGVTGGEKDRKEPPSGTRFFYYSFQRLLYQPLWWPKKRALRTGHQNSRYVEVLWRMHAGTNCACVKVRGLIFKYIWYLSRQTSYKSVKTGVGTSFKSSFLLRSNPRWKTCTQTCCVHNFAWIQSQSFSAFLIPRLIVKMLSLVLSVRAVLADIVTYLFEVSPHKAARIKICLLMINLKTFPLLWKFQMIPAQS